jgi:hypothetical protein
MIPLSFFACLSVYPYLFCVLCFPCIMQSVQICESSPTTNNTSLILPLPVLDLAESFLQSRKQTPRLHRSTQHTKAHQHHPRQGQHNSKCNPVCLYRVSDSKISRHILGKEGEWKEQDGRFADEQRHPRKAIDTSRLRHGHELKVLFWSCQYETDSG